MLLVSKNPKVIDLIERAHDREPLREAMREGLIRRFDHAESLADMLECATLRPYGFVAFDYDSFEKEPHKVYAAGAGDSRLKVVDSFFVLNPRTVSLLLLPDNLGAHPRVNDAAIGLKAQKVFHYAQLKQDAEWHDLFYRFRHNTLEWRVRDGYWNAVQMTGRQVLAQPYVEIILQLSPRYRDVAELIEGTVARGGVLTPKSLSRALHTQDQLTAKTLLMTFRTMWYTNLVEHGWPKKRIAHYLQYPDSREMRRTLHRQSVKLGDMDHVTFAEALAWAADWTTRPHLGNPPSIAEILPSLIHGQYKLCH